MIERQLKKPLKEKGSQTPKKTEEEIEKCSEKTKKDCEKNERKKFDKSMCIMTVVLLNSVISSDGMTSIWP